jgi:midasin
MLLAERLRIDEEKDCVRNVLETEMKVTIDMEDSYYGKNSEGRVMLDQALAQKSLLSESGLNIDSIAPTKSILRLLSLVMRCIKQKEPVLLVGDTGCGKVNNMHQSTRRFDSVSQLISCCHSIQTTVVQLLSVILQTHLTVVNCHASTETSDLLGGFRPIRGRQNIVLEMTQKVTGLIQNWSDTSFDISSIAPSSNEPKVMVEFLKELSGLYLANSTTDLSGNDTSDKKRRKLANGDVASSYTKRLHGELVHNTLQEVTVMYQKYTSLFEWVDGPLVTSMKDGCMLLLDEMSLAEDAVLERLNSVLEPSRTITLAEKGGEGPACSHEVGIFSLSSEVKADEHFRIFATMNPGGGEHLIYSL